MNGRGYAQEGVLTGPPSSQFILIRCWRSELQTNSHDIPKSIRLFCGGLACSGGWTRQSMIFRVVVLHPLGTCLFLVHGDVVAY